MQDIRQTLRGLLRAPGFTIVAVLTIALGIGASTAVYSLVHHVLFRPLPFLDGDRLVAVWETAPDGNDHNELAPANFADLRAAVRSLDQLAAHTGTNANLTGGDRPERVQGFAVTANFFDVLDVRPLLGRTFAGGEDTRGSDAFVVLSHGLWTRRFGADSAIVGQSIMVNGRARQVIGVLPEGVRYPSAAELYVPLAPTPEALASRRAHYLLVTGRLAPGATVEQARAEVTAVMRRLAAQYPETNSKWGGNVQPLIPDVTRVLQPALVVLLAAVGFVMLVVCANMANLMLARGLSRQRELYVRAALGARGGHLARRVLVESTMVAMTGALLGIALGILGLRGLLAIVPAEHTRFLAGFDRVELDGPVLAMAAVVTVLVSVLASAIPAWRASRAVSLDADIRASGRGAARSRHRVRGALVAVETGIAIVLLVGAGLMTRTFSFLSSRATGVDVARTALTTVALPALRYPNDTVRLAFFRESLARLRALPGVTQAGASTVIPMCQCNQTTSFTIDGGAPFAPGEEPDVGQRVITPGYLESLGIAMRTGRAFSDADRQDAPRVVIVNEALARRWFPDGAVGRRLVLSDTTQRYEIVGVVADVRHGGPAAEPEPELYVPLDQNPASELTLAVRTDRGDPADILPSIRRIVGEIDPELPVYDARTMRRVALLAIGPVRLSASLLGALSLLALLLTMVGVYGVASQLVAERTREIGIRMALGGVQAHVVRFIVGRGLGAVCIGAAAGLVAAALLGKVVASQLVGVPALDPVTYLAVAALLFAAALLAIYVPARRVARVDPLLVLRHEGGA